MSKDSRRAARAARDSRRAAAAAAGQPGAEASGSTGGSAAASAGGSPAGAPAASHASSPSGVRKASHGPSGSARAGRRERTRTYRKPSFFERYRTAIVSVGVVAIAAVAIGWIFLGSTAAAWTCTNQFNPAATPTVEPGSSTRLGFVQDDMGRSHAVTVPQNYLYCPPASGTHLNAAGLGPIQPRVYKPTDKVGPPNWVHNLEHGAMVVLYRTDSPGASDAGQLAFRNFFNTFPASPLCGIPAGQLSPVIAPFNDMPHPYAALVWGRVLYMDTWDPSLAIQFYNEESERVDTNGDLVAPPEDVTGCAARLKASSSPSAAPSDAAPSASGAPSAAPSTTPSAAPSTEPSPSAS